jgi:hypothetical protein
VASKEIGLGGNADTTECVVVCGGKKAGKCHSIKKGRIPSEIVTTFKYCRNALKL